MIPQEEHYILNSQLMNSDYYHTMATNNATYEH